MTGCHSTNTPLPETNSFCPWKIRPGPQKGQKIIQPSIFRCYVSFRRVDSTEWDLFKWLSNRMAWYGQTIFNSKRLLHELRLGVTRHVSKCSIYQGNLPKDDLNSWSELMSWFWTDSPNGFTIDWHGNLKTEAPLVAIIKTILMGWEREKVLEMNTGFWRKFYPTSPETRIGLEK